MVPKMVFQKGLTKWEEQLSTFLRTENLNYFPSLIRYGSCSVALRILPKMAPEKIDSFVPENFQGFLFHYLGVFVPGLLSHYLDV